jgi:acyl-coenzyme A synthetase/AMP-(fatty) acid ligase
MQQKKVSAFCLLMLLASCQNNAGENKNTLKAKTTNPNEPQMSIISNIKPPEGFIRSIADSNSFTCWLRKIPLRKDKTVYLYNGLPKRNQGAQFAVLNKNIGNTNLVQCADAVMKLRAEYLFDTKQYDKIVFLSTTGEVLNFSDWEKGYRWREQNNRLVKYLHNKTIVDRKEKFKVFMEMIYTYCGTYSLSKQLHTVNKNNSLSAGDVFIRGGFPGHAVLIVDDAENTQGEKVFLLAQSYMPAQDIHILKNPANEKSPWYSSRQLFPLITPEWEFASGSLMKW